MFVSALSFILDAVINLFLLALLLRFYLQLVRAPYNNQLSQFVIAFTNFVVKPARRVIPGLKGYDLATLCIAWIAAFVLKMIPYWLGQMDTFIAVAKVSVYPMFAYLATLYLFKLSVYILMGAVLIQAVLSWINPYSPIGPLVDSLTRPFLKPLQKRVPLVGGVDLSPLIMLLACQLILMFPVAYLERLASRIS
jgi:YggT family protein